MKEKDLNILLFAPDTIRRDHLSCYDYKRKTTPNLEKMMERRILFSDHVGNSGWTLPQYITIHTGIHPLIHKVNLLKFNFPLSPKATTIAQILKKHGYATQAFSSNNYYLSPQLGHDRGFDTYIWGLGYNRATERITNNVIKWLDESAKRKFFLFIHTNDTHEPFNPPEPFNSKWGEEYVDKYDGEISYVDFHFGRILDKLEELGIKENTLIIYTSDHGTEFREHGFLEKKVNLYNEILHIPLIMSCPSKLPKGKTINGLIATKDIVPTILDILDLPPKRDSQGQSFLPLIKGDPEFQPREQIYSHTQHNPREENIKQPSFEHFSVYTNRYKFIRAKILLPFTKNYFEIRKEGGGNWVTRFKTLAERCGMDPEKIKKGTVFRELYDLKNDPMEQKNIQTEQPKIASELESKLNKWIVEAKRKSKKLPVRKRLKPIWPFKEKISLPKDIEPKCSVPIRVNVGGNKYVDEKDRVWLADQPYIPEKWGYTTRTFTDIISTSQEIKNTVNSTLYQNQRFGHTFIYFFNVPNGKYKVNLLFAETIMKLGGVEFFNVYLQDKLVLDSYNIFNDAGGRNKAVKRSFECEVENNLLSIRLEARMEPQQEAAKLSGIEILS